MTNNQKLKHLKNLVRISEDHVNKIQSQMDTILALENKIRKDIELLESAKNNPINK